LEVSYYLTLEFKVFKENLIKIAILIPTMSSVESLREVVQRLERTFNDPQNRESHYFDFYDDSLVIHGFPPNLPANKDGFMEFDHFMWKAFPDIKITFEEIIIEGNKVACRYKLSGTHTGEFRVGIFRLVGKFTGPTNKKFNIEGMTVFSFRESKIVERWNLVDMMSLMEQLGMS
jgi:predicted ester cyclase